MDQVTLDRWKSHEPGILRVSEVSAIITGLLMDGRLEKIWVTGEITNFKRHSSGHLYFSLSEKNGSKEAVISCSIWKTHARYLAFSPEDGMEVQAYGSVSHYEPGGRYSFQITQMRPSGSGEKALLIERWRREMAEKGWFSPERKRTLPKFPERIGVVTSPTGAVIHDIQNVISGRFPAEIVLSPASVQGANAHEEIAAAIRRIQGLVDVLIVGRGGGSYEDLFPFNHPLVVEAIVNCPVPVVAAIGHEVDITLADLAADFSASTPSHAAEQCVPDRKGELEILGQLNKRMFRILLKRLETAEEEINDLRDRLSPGRLAREVTKRREYLADITERMVQAGTGSTHRAELLLLELKGRLRGRDPKAILSREIPERRSFLAETRERLHGSVSARLERRVLELKSLSAIISAQGPESVFRKGFCLVQRDGCIISSAGDIHPGDAVRIRFADGTADAEIRRVQHDKNV